jgi:hypothetical protein
MLGFFDNLDALSYGQDPIRARVYFSVDRVAVGSPGTAVFDQATDAEAAGDVFVSLPGSNRLGRDEVQLGLAPGFFGDDLDALALVGGANTFFSMDYLSESNGFGTSTLQNDIFVNHLSNVFASGEHDLLLHELDDIDALVLLDRGTPGVLDPGIDLALFSLSIFSPSTYLFGSGTYVAGLKGSLSPADVLFTDFQTEFLPGQRWKLWTSAADIGLREFDELDALATVPEPTGLVIWSALAIGFVASRGRFKERRQERIRRRK